MTNIFAVVGEHRWEPGRLLLLGEDGRYYAYRADGAPLEVEPSAAWNLDEEALAAAVRSIPVAVRPYRPVTAARPVEQVAEPGRRRATSRSRMRG
jgi:hypothetical protein